MARYFNPERFDCQMAVSPKSIGDNGSPSPFKKDEVILTLKKIIGDSLQFEVSAVVLPMALRWFVHPELGFPIAPFKVYRRAVKNGYPQKKIGFIQENNTYTLSPETYYGIKIYLQNTTAANVNTTLTLLDHKSNPIASTSKSYTFLANQSLSLQFLQPDIKGFTFTNVAGLAITSVEGITMTAFLNDANWQLSQIVGLPFKKAEIKPIIYIDELQGYINNLTDGSIAAVQRAAIGKAFYKEPNYAQTDATILPAWEIPDAQELVNAVRKTENLSVKTGILNDIREMLAEVLVNRPEDYEGVQKNYFKEIKSKGISDGGDAASQDGIYQNYVCSTSLLGAATDMWLSLALGFGTMEFSAFNSQTPFAATASQLEYDYMVTSVFSEPNYKVNMGGTFPFFSYENIFDGFTQTEYAAIAHLAPNTVETPFGLTTANIASARPLMRDQFYIEDTLIEWGKPVFKAPIAYAVALKDPLTGIIAYLNQTRIFLPNKHQPFVGAHRADGQATALELTRLRFVHPKSPLPLTGTVIKNYYLAAMDVFGRWSNWEKTTRLLTAKPPQNAQIIQARFFIDSSSTADHIFPATLEMTIAWDWDDRSPLDIDIAGQFVPLSDTIIDPESLVKTLLVSKNSAGSELVDYSIAFNNSNVPFMTRSVTSSVPFILPISEATVVEDRTDNEGSATKKYKVQIHNFNLNFENNSKLAFGLYVRAREKTNPSAWTSFTTSAIVIANDPLPRAAPTFSPEIRWASLPDATNTARYFLSFPAIAHVAGYAIYRATETALRDKAILLPINDNMSLNDRINALHSLTGAAKFIAKDAFIRLNPKLIEKPNIEVALNGDVDGLYIYAVTSMTPENEESGFSDWVYVGVPRRFTPRPAVLTGFTKKVTSNPGQCEIIIDIDLSKGTKSQRVELFRTTRASLSSDIDLMGLADKSATIVPIAPASTIPGLAANWEAFDENDNPVVSQDQAILKLRSHDIVPRSWLPLYYRVVTYGEEDKNAGKYPGRSKSSNLLEITPLVPENPPALRDILLTGFNAGLLRLTFKTNAAIQTSAFGDHRIVIQKFNQGNQIFEKWLDNAIPSIPKKQAANIAAVGALRRTTKTTDDFWEFETFVEIEDKVSLSLSVIDPKGRKTDLPASYTRPAVIKPKITGAAKVRLLQRLEIRFASNVSNAIHDEGIYTLSITRKLLTGTVKLLSVNMNNIPISLPATNLGIMSTGRVIINGEKMTGYLAAFKTTIFDSGANEPITITITDPLGRNAVVTF